MSDKDYFMLIQEELTNTINDVENGELSNLDGLIKMRKAKEQAEKVLETVKTFEDSRINEISQEAESYGGTYCGFEIKQVNGKQLFNFKGIPAVVELETKEKEAEEKFKSAFIGFQKGITQTKEVDGVLYWIDENSELQPFPELTIGKSYLTVKEKKQK